MLARDVRIDRGGAQTVVAQRVTFERPGGALVVLAQHVEGNVRPLLDWRGALVLGGIVAAVLALVRGRKKG